MRKTALTLTLTGLAGFALACSTATTQTPGTNSNAPKTQANSNTATTAAPPTIVSGHSSGGPTTATPTTVPAQQNGAPPAANGDEEAAAIPKPLQEKVKQAEAKASATNASPADKIAAANALVERGNVFYEAGQPRLYKYALRDFRMAARLNPANAEAAGKRDQIIQIYESMGRPVPTLGDQP